MLLTLLAGFGGSFILKTWVSLFFEQVSLSLSNMFCLRTPHPCQADLKSSEVN